MNENSGETPQWRREIGNIPVELNKEHMDPEEVDHLIDYFNNGWLVEDPEGL